MSSRIFRPLAAAAIALSATALSAGVASAEAPAPVSGSVEVCLPIHLGPVEVSFCL